MAGSVLPQELVDAIIEHIEDDASLHSSARINSSWLAPSQRRLFHFVSLAQSRHKSLSHNDLVARLLLVLNNSPYISSYIRRLELDPSQVVPSKTEPMFIRLTRLEEVRVVDFQDAPMFTCPSHHPFHSLLSLPNLSRLTIGPGAWYLGDVMPCLRGGQNVRALSLEDVIFEGYGYGVCANLARLPGIELEELIIQRGFVGLLADLHSLDGLELGRLKKLAVLLGIRNAQSSMRWRTITPIAAINDVLKSNCGTLECLSLDVFLDQPLCNLFDLSRLRSLSLHVRWHIAQRSPEIWLQWIISSFQGMTKPSMMEEFMLRITTYADDEVPDMSEGWGCLDKLLARSTMARLQRVVIEQNAESGKRLKDEEFPMLHARGVPITWY